MASEIRLATGVRNNMLEQIVTAIGASGLLRIYDGEKPPGPATAPTGQVLLAELALSATAGTVADGVLTFGAIATDAAANATGAASWYRVTSAGGAGVVDGTVGTAASDLVMNTTAVVAGGPVAVTAFSYTAPGG